MLNLDTHILIHAFSDDLSKSERKVLRQHEWAISGIVLWELSKLVQLERISLDLDSIEFSRLMSQIVILPITRQIAVQSTRLDFESDPADELIAATSVVHKVPLLTRDKKISKSRIVPLVTI
jgi:PIN domain nuclease of toxin-antitoxin system